MRRYDYQHHTGGNAFGDGGQCGGMADHSGHHGNVLIARRGRIGTVVATLGPPPNQSDPRVFILRPASCTLGVADLLTPKALVRHYPPSFQIRSQASIVDLFFSDHNVFAGDLFRRRFTSLQAEGAGLTREKLPEPRDLGCQFG